MKKLFGFSLIICLSAAALWSEPGIIKQCEDLMQENKIEECQSLLEKGIAETTESAEKAELYWRLSRTVMILADRKPRTKTNAGMLLREYEKGAELASRAVALDKKSFEGYFWRASHWSRWAQVKGGLEALAKAGMARDDLYTVIRLNPSYEFAYYILGLLFTSLPGWPLSYGNRDFGISLLRRSIDMIEKPENALGFYLNLAGALWQRNWNADTRNSRRTGMKKEFGVKKDAVEKYFFYEGVVDFSKSIVSGGTVLSELSDREEAMALLDHAEAQAVKLLNEPDDVKKMKEAVNQVRRSLK